MAPRLRGMLTVGCIALALAQAAAAPPARAQEVLDIPISTRLLMAFHEPSIGLWDLSAVPMSTRLLMAFRAESLGAPGLLTGPYGSFVPYGAPQAFPAPPLEPVPVTTVILRADTAPAPVQVNAGAVVTWVNETTQERTLVIETVPAPGGSGWTSRQTAAAAPNSSLSLAFHQPGTYEYYLQDQPASRARIVVSP